VPKQNDHTAATVVASAIRTQILIVAAARDVSPSRFVTEVMQIDPSEDPGTFRLALSRMSYHFRAIREEGLIGIVDRIPSRGSVENVYRAVPVSGVRGADESAFLQRKAVDPGTNTWRNMVARVEAARMAGNLGPAETHDLFLNEADLDAQGRLELSAVVNAAIEDTRRVCDEAETRLRASRQPGVKAIVALVEFRPADVDQLPVAKGVPPDADRSR
jgi:hypothetical protein